jgi:hypothetical protein
MRKVFILLPTLLAVILLGLYLNKPATLPLPNAKTVLGRKDDPLARFNFEQNRLKSPHTGEVPHNIRVKEIAFSQQLPIKRTLAKAGSSAGQNWVKRGPHNVGGRTRALAIDVGNENHILAGGVSGGMFRSTDGGASWQMTTTAGQLHSATCLAQSKRSGAGNIWYFGTGEYYGNSASGGGAFFSGDGIYKSTDGGISWSLLENTATGRPQSFENYFDYIWNIAVDPSASGDDEIYVATYGRIYRSTDGGNNFTAVLDAVQCAFTDVAVTNSGVVYATFSADGQNKKGIFRSTDGINWTSISPSFIPSDYRRIVIGLAPSNENIVYFLGTDNDGDIHFWKYTYISGNGSGSGGNWENRSANIPVTTEDKSDGLNAQGGYNLVCKVKPDDENVVFAGGTNLFRSDNGFANSSKVYWIGGYSNDSAEQAENHHPDQHALVFYPSNTIKLISGHDGGLSRTNNAMVASDHGVRWQSLNNGYYTTQFYTVAIDHAANNDNQIAGGMQDNGTWMSLSQSATSDWLYMFSGDGSYCAIADGKTHHYFSWQNGGVYRLKLNSQGNLQDWAEVDPEGGSGYLFINPFILDPNNTKMMYMAGGEYIWRNSDLTQIPSQDQKPQTKNWTQLTNAKVSGKTISAIEATVTPANILYFGAVKTEASEVKRIDNAHTGNPSSVDISSGLPSPGYVSCIAANPQNGNEVVVIFSNYEIISIWHSTNAGAAWTNISGNLEQFSNGSGNGPSVRWFEIAPTPTGTVYYAATSTGLYSTNTLNGTSTIWEQEGASVIGNVVVDMMDYRTTDNLLVVATHGNGVYATNVTYTSIENEPPTVAKHFKLEQNYPNPFNPNTHIQFSLDEPSKVKLEIYNVTGQRIVTLLNNQFPAGDNFKATWNGQNDAGHPVPSGVYIYKLNANGKSISKKMQLIR